MRLSTVVYAIFSGRRAIRQTRGGDGASGGHAASWAPVLLANVLLDKADRVLKARGYSFAR